MNFTYRAYEELLDLLEENKYDVQNYHNYQESPQCVILRHDVDMSIDAAMEMARLETQRGVQATYFVLLTSDFYNVFSENSRAGLMKIQSQGHEIGLHFDEMAYAPADEDTMVQSIRKECGLLSELLGTRVSSVSMHRPSAETLNADLQIPGIVNSYGKTFFHDFKYLSDSRRRWREPVLDVIRSKKYARLHILTHAFWYHEQEESLADSVGTFIRSAKRERYLQMEKNITDLKSILSEVDVL